MKNKVIAYVDGFNLFYCCLKGTPYKWLDLYKLAESMLQPEDELVAIKYFTAKIKSHKNEPERSMRQNVYLEALATNPKINIKLGYFSVHKTKMPLADEWDNGQIKMIDVIKTEEKGTDVNLAVQMVADAKDNLFDKALLFSNDSDMSYAVQIAAKDCHKTIGLFIDRNAVSFKTLKENVTFIKRLTPSIFASNQLPEEIVTSTGRVIHKPSEW
jgi:uncharacterized LabA/DUF88 family protein